MKPNSIAELGARAAAEVSRRDMLALAGSGLFVLFSAEQITRTAQFQIKRSDLEPSAQVREFTQRGETFARDFAQFGVRGNQQICVSATVRTPHSSAQLIKLAQAMAIGRPSGTSSSLPP